MNDIFRIMWIILIACAVIWFFYTIYLFAADNSSRRQEERNNPCVIEHPMEAVSGKIVHPIGVFSNEGPVTYYVSYKGKRKLTGDECLRRISVTESEYERRMYMGTNQERKSNMMKAKKYCFLLAILLCMTSLFIGIYKPFNNSKISNSSCVIVHPLQALYGYIVVKDMTSGNEETKYYVHYIGKHQETGDVCTERVVVTESEYIRTMSGD